MTVYFNNFKKELYDTFAKETIVPFEDQIDDKLKAFTNLSTNEQKARIKINHGTILELTEIKDILNMDKFDDEQQEFIRNTIVKDYRKAGWKVSYDYSPNSYAGQYPHILKISK